MKQFKTESKKLLDLMINSIYTNKEIFLRELISNASDALDKLSFEGLTDESKRVDEELAIDLSFDKDARTITVADNGIGMTADELDKNLGTIAHSGSQEFKSQNADAQGDAVDIIGQFGVGFYSSFMVAKRVRVVSRALGEGVAHSWESDGVSGYSIDEVAEADLPEALRGERAHGTQITLFLRDSTEEDDTDQFLSEWKLRELVTQYSNYVRYPVRMMVTKSRQKPAPDPKPDDYKPEYEDYTEVATINSMIPIWKRRKSEVSDEDYNEFYKSNFHDFEDPLRSISVHAEGALTYDALLFIPGRAPFDMYSRDFEKGLALYSSNVLIMDKCADLLPDYYNFVRGIVDSADLTLNISRETLQRNSQLHAIANKVEKKITSELEKMRDNEREDYEKFFQAFGRSLKFGVYQTYGSKTDELAPLFLFWSAKDQKLVTLDECIEAMDPEQKDKKEIYYAAGESRDTLMTLPSVKSALKKGYDVLLCTEDVDEFTIQSMRAYKEFNMKNVTSADLDLATEDEKKQAADATKENEELFAAMKELLGDKVSDVVVSPTLEDAPSAIAAKGMLSLEMERVLAQGPDAERAKAQRVLQLNAKHPVFEKLKAAKAADDSEKLGLYTELLYDQALLVERMPIEDPVAFAEAICKLM